MHTTREYIDLLVREFWKRGFSIEYRKFGKYLPNPPLVGSFHVDIIAKKNRDYAIGIFVSDSDISDMGFFNRINYLSSRISKFNKKNVELMIGVSFENYKAVKELLNSMDFLSRPNLNLIILQENEVDLFSAASQKQSNYTYIPFN